MILFWWFWRFLSNDANGLCSTFLHGFIQHQFQYFCFYFLWFAFHISIRVSFCISVILDIHKNWVSLLLENMSLGTVFNISKSEIIRWWEIFKWDFVCQKSLKTHPLILWYLIIVFLIQYMRWIWCKFKYYLKLFSLVPDWENDIFFIKLLRDWSLLLFK